MNLIHADALGTLPKAQYLGSTHLVARGLNILFGPSGVCKSFYMLDQALRVAQTAPVVYVAAEGASGLHSRVSAWCTYYGQSSGNLYFICQEVNLLQEAGVEKLVKTISEKLKTQVAIVIFDTYARCMIGGDENSAKDTGRMIQHCARIQRALQCAIGLVHHTNRAERGERGSGALRGAADTMIEMNNIDGVIRVECSKAKDSSPWQTETYRLIPIGDDDEGSGVLVPSAEVQASQRLTAAQLKILEHLALEVFTDAGSTSRQISDGTSIAVGTVWRVLSSLKANSHVIQDAKGDPYRITNVGKQALFRELSRGKQPANVVDMKDFQANSHNSHALSEPH